MIKIFPQSNSLEFTQALVNTDKLNTFGNGYVLGKIHKTKFANGEITVVIEESVRNESVVIVSQPRNYEDIFELCETIDAARRASAKEIIAIVPYLPHSRQERRDEKDGQVVRTTISARLLADMLQVSGLNRLITMDVHTTAIEGFYTIPIDNLDPSALLIEQIKLLDLKNPVIVSPDLGGMKRAEKYAEALDYDMAVINKKRKKANVVDKMKLIGSVKDADVIIVDDMIDTGGTIMKALDLLDENGANNFYVFASHGIFSGRAVLEFAENSHNPQIYTTNTLPLEIDKMFYQFNTINVVGEFHKALKKIFSV